jgi:hypothetical protein
VAHSEEMPIIPQHCGECAAGTELRHSVSATACGCFRKNHAGRCVLPQPKGHKMTIEGHNCCVLVTAVNAHYSRAR